MLTKDLQGWPELDSTMGSSKNQTRYAMVPD